MTEISGDWIWQTDGRGVLTYVSEGIRANLGFGPEQLLGRRLIDLSEAEATSPDRLMQQRLIDSRASFRSMLIRCRHADGDERLVTISGSPRISSTGDFLGYNGIGSDTTSEFRLNEARSAAQAKDGFLAAMSHEIRTPLNGVLGILDILSNTTLSDDQRRLVSIASSSGDALLHLINEVLDLSKIEAGRLELLPEAADLVSTVTSAVEMLRPLAGKNGTQISIKAEGSMPALLEFDPNRYRQVLVNFLGNAIKFTKNGTIDVSLKVVGEYASSLVVRTSVIDTGPGIAPDKQKLLFKEFSMLADPDRTNTSGTGLGLALCKRLATAMNGSVGVQSAEGKGSTFWFEATFARCSASGLAKMSQAGANARPAETPPLKILLAEDNPTNALVATRMLGAAGHQVQHEADGRQALVAFTKSRYDIVLMDVSMPVMDGISAAKAIRRLEAERNLVPTPIVALTAHVVITEREKILAAGMSACLSKPVRRNELLETVARFGARAKADSPAPKMVAAAAAPPSPASAAASPVTTSSSPPVQSAKSQTFAALCAREPILDLETVNVLAEESGADTFPQLLGIFRKEIEGRSRQLSRAQESRDVVLLTKTCHAIAGSAATIGGKRLYKACKLIEEASLAKPDPRFLMLVPAVQKEIAALVTAVFSAFSVIDTDAPIISAAG